ncbi:MAG: AraC family transcriptional regulator [Clostridia bacterium]|nr:AraC family transcriptional regulator [Clostridia bacterium]
MEYFYENKKDNFYCRDSRYTKGGLRCDAHLHYHIELALVHEGHEQMTVDSTVYSVEDGDLLVVFPYQIHRFDTVRRSNYTLIIVNPDLLSDLSPYFSGFRPVSNLLKGGAMDAELRSLADRIVSLWNGEDSPYRTVILNGYLLCFFGRLLEKLELASIQTRDSDALGSILNYCILHSTEPLSLSVLERELHISRCYISHIISEKLGLGFNEYINSLRISNACKLLRESELPMTEISEQAGFNTMRTFNRAFSKQMGMTPSQYRTKKHLSYSPFQEE